MSTQDKGHTKKAVFTGVNLPTILQAVRDELSNKGVDFDAMWEAAGLQEHGMKMKIKGRKGDDCADQSECSIPEEGCCTPGNGRAIKVVCMEPGLRSSVEELGEHPRGQVVMVRVDESTQSELDAWVETGAVKSRSEAAALFIREGLKVRADELKSLSEALKEVEVARARLRARAEEVFGTGE